MWSIITALKFFMACVIFTILCGNCFFRCASDLQDTDPLSQSYQVMLGWYMHYVTCLVYHQLDIFVYTHTVSHATHYSAISRGLLKSFNPLYLWMHTRYFPYGPDVYYLIAVCFGHVLKEGFNIMEIWTSRSYEWCRQVAATFQIFVLVCIQFCFFYSLCCLIFVSDYEPPYPWQLIVLNVPFLFCLMVLYFDVYMNEFVMPKME